MRKFSTDYDIKNSTDYVRSERKFRQDVDLRLDALEENSASIDTAAREVVDRAVLFIEQQVVPKATEIAEMLEDFREGLPAALVVEEEDVREFLTPARRAAIIADLRDGVASAGDTLAKLYALTEALAGVDDDLAGAISDVVSDISGITSDISGLTTSVANRLRFDTASALTALQMIQGRKNLGIGSAKDARRSRIVNGGMMISQENCNGTGTANGFFPVDQFFYAKSHDGTISVGQVESLTPGGSPNRIRATVTATDTSIGASQYAMIVQIIEGVDVADFRFGSASAEQGVLRFGVRAPAGTYCVAVRNAGAYSRTWIGEFTVEADEANTDVVKTLVIPGDVTGTWATGTTGGFNISWAMAAGTTYRGSGGWQSGVYYATSNQTNLLATNGAVFELFDVGLYLDADATGTAPAWELPDYTEELRKCQRFLYLWKPSVTSAHIGALRMRAQATTPFATGALFDLPVDMRVAPVVSCSSPDHFTVVGSSGAVATALTFAGSNERTIVGEFSTASGVGADAGFALAYTNTTSAWIKASARF